MVKKGSSRKHKGGSWLCNKTHKHRHGRKHKHSRSRYNKKGGEGVLATAAVPFGILALQRYFKGSKTSKRGVRNMGTSFKRTFRRRY